MESIKKSKVSARLKEAATGARAILCALLIPLIFGAKAEEAQASPQPTDISFSETGEIQYPTDLVMTPLENNDPPTSNTRCGR
ncbi:MAG: hypothetical protein HKN21_11640 [Candidatus Eisenbacteria bacterium]|uniref:Uncharacterized protein n=1 Tax=Eiseniibacteriota bacterium TaxID=2212470 RepID=A0A7Y2EA76_UNCEI|nr:hypothetical protein [Candidatus Eisenbacteria bacterium]